MFLNTLSNNTTLIRFELWLIFIFLLFVLVQRCNIGHNMQTRVSRDHQRAWYIPFVLKIISWHPQSLYTIYIAVTLILWILKCVIFWSHFIVVFSRGVWGKLSHQVSWVTPLNSTKKAQEKMIMSSIVWSHSKDLLHLAALKIRLQPDRPRPRVRSFRPRVR